SDAASRTQRRRLHLRIVEPKGRLSLMQNQVRARKEPLATCIEKHILVVGVKSRHQGGVDFVGRQAQRQEFSSNIPKIWPIARAASCIDEPRGALALHEKAVD